MNIEEVAFKDRKNLVQLNENDLLDIIEFLQKDRKDWINQFSKTHNESIEIQKENQVLKKKYENAVADYETAMAEKSELKKQVEEYKATNEILSQELTKDKVLQQDHLTTCCGIPIGNIPKLITQQKEFINYLEDKIYTIEPKGTGINYNCEYDSEEDYINAMKEQSRLNTLKEILQKYKEIIGVLDDKTN